MNQYLEKNHFAPADSPLTNSTYIGYILNSCLTGNTVLNKVILWQIDIPIPAFHPNPNYYFLINEGTWNDFLSNEDIPGIYYDNYLWTTFGMYVFDDVHHTY